MSNYSGLDSRSIAKWEAEQADPYHNPIPEPNNGKEAANNTTMFVVFVVFPIYLGWHFSKWIIRHSGGYFTGFMFFYYHLFVLMYLGNGDAGLRNWYIHGWDNLGIGSTFHIFFVIKDQLTEWSYFAPEYFQNIHAGKFYLVIVATLFVYTLVRWAFKSPEKKEIISQKNLADKENYNSITNKILFNPFIWFYLSYKLAAPSKN